MIGRICGDKNEELYDKYGISVGKKLGNAVERNHAKRHVREIMRPLLKTLPSYSLVIVIKDTSKNVSFEIKKKSLEKLIEKMIRKENLSNE